MNRLAYCAVALALIPSSGLQAQTRAIDELKGRIFDAKMTAKTFANGLPFCKDLDGTNFYFEVRNRVLGLQDYHRSLENLVREQVFNPATRRPWNEQDAEARWQQVQKEALDDKAKCALVTSLPELERQLAELEKKAGAPPGPPAPNK